MIPFRLNVISAEKKRYHMHMVYIEFFKNMLELLLFTICITGIAFLLGLLLLRSHLHDMSSTMALAASPYIQKNREIHTVNQALKTVDDIQAEYLLWTDVLAEFSGTLPSGIALDTLDIDFSKNILKLSGRANSRDELLVFSKQLEALPWVNPVSIPLSQLIGEPPLVFSIETPLTR